MSGSRKFEVDINLKVNDEGIRKAQAEIRELDNSSADVDVTSDDSEVKKVKNEVDEIDNESVEPEMKVDDSDFQKKKREVDDLDGKDIKLNLAMESFSQGLSTAKQGISDLASHMNEVAQAGMQTEQNMAFLKMNLGAEKAKSTMQDISNIVASMPGDDNTMRSVLSTAQALGNNLKPQEMKDATGTMADYMSASATMGKQAVESQQDIMKYLLDGNTAELERGSIVSSRVDKLKEATTFMERQKAMQEVLNELGYGGISQQDTMLNKQAEWEGMIYNSQDALSSMWLGAQKGAMDYILQLNDATNGIVGMGIVASQMVLGPFTDIMTGLGQIGTGFKTLSNMNLFEKLGGKLDGFKNRLKDIGTTAKNVFTGIPSKLSALKTSLINVGNTAKTTALRMLELGKSALIAGYNALKAGAMWLVEKARLIASTIASYAAEAAQWALNLAMSANPIGIIIVAITALIAVLGYLYFNNEQVKNAVDGVFASLQSFLGLIVGGVQSAISGFISWLGNLYSWLSQLGTQVSGAVNGVIGVLTGIIDSIVGILNGIWVAVINWFTMLQTMIPQQVLLLIIGVINTLNPFASLISGVLARVLPVFLSRASSWISGTVGKVKSLVSSVVSTVSSLPSKISSAISGVVNAFTSPFRQAWNVISPILSQIENGVNTIRSVIPFMGFDGSADFGFEDFGFDGTLNNTISSASSNGGLGNTTINNNNTFNGIIEEAASQYIVDSITSYTRKQNLIRGR